MGVLIFGLLHIHIFALRSFNAVEFGNEHYLIISVLFNFSRNDKILICYLWFSMKITRGVLMHGLTKKQAFLVSSSHYETASNFFTNLKSFGLYRY